MLIIPVTDAKYIKYFFSLTSLLNNLLMEETLKSNQGAFLIKAGLETAGLALDAIPILSLSLNIEEGEGEIMTLLLSRLKIKDVLLRYKTRKNGFK